MQSCCQLAERYCGGRVCTVYKRHGPYWQHTSKIRNKTVTRRLTPAQAAQYQEWIANERALRDLIAQMQQISDEARDLLLTDPEQGRQQGS